jgi:hypothetical protein
LVEVMHMTIEVAQATPLTNGRTRKLLGLLSVAVTAIAAAAWSPSPAHAAPGARDSWTHPATIPSAKTSAPPSLIVDDGVLYAFWMGESSHPGIWYSGYNGTVWTHPVKVPGATNSPKVGAALALYEGGLYVFYAGKTSGVWYSVYNGTTWSAQVRLPSAVVSATSASEMAADVYLGDIYLAWPGKAPARDINYAAFNGTTWTTPRKVTHAASGNSAFDLYLGDLYLSWWSCAGCEVHSQTFNGTTWSSPAAFTSDAGGGPGLAVFLGDLDDAWIATPSGAVTVTPFNGTTWLAPTTIPSSSADIGCAGVALDVYTSSVVAVWGPVGGCGGAIDYSAGP